jgi:DME family drug/metabolite transporter
MSSQTQDFKGVVVVIIASFLWGTTGTAASFTPDVSPLATGAFSMGIGGVLLFVSAWPKLREEYQHILAHPVLLLLGAMSVVIYPLAFYSSMRLSGVAIGTVVSIASAPFFAALLERLISKKNISRQWCISFIIGALGIIFLTLGKDQENANAEASLAMQLGIILGLIAGLSYAIYSWAAKQLINDGIHPKCSMAALFGFAALFLLTSLFFTGDNLIATPTNASIALYMAIFPTFCGYLLFGYGLRFIDASRATLITLIEPLIATVLAIIVVGERLKLIGWVGLMLVMICLMLQTFKYEIKRKQAA